MADNLGGKVDVPIVGYGHNLLLKFVPKGCLWGRIVINFGFGGLDLGLKLIGDKFFTGMSLGNLNQLFGLSGKGSSGCLSLEMVGEINDGVSVEVKIEFEVLAK